MSKMVNSLTLNAVIGFRGDMPGAMILHPDNERVIFAIGSSVSVRNISERTQTQFQCHSNPISALALSKCGRFVATGEESHMGFPADIVIWDIVTKEAIHKLKLHKGKIQSLSFSCDGKYLVSLGGTDDNSLVMWCMETGKSLCGTQASTDKTTCVSFFNKSPYHLVTCGAYTFKLWTLDVPNKKLRGIECTLGTLKRIATSFAIDQNDEKIFIGTTTGDIIESHIAITDIKQNLSSSGIAAGVSTSATYQHPITNVPTNNSMCTSYQPKYVLSGAVYKRCTSAKKLFPLGVTCVKLLSNGDLIVGTGNGTVARLCGSTLNIVGQSSVLGAITSICMTADEQNFFVITNQCNLYWGEIQTMSCELRNSSHSARVNCISFPYECSDVFATASIGEIRVWQSSTRHELLRIQVPKVECFCVIFSRDGKSIISGWSDGKIRAFLPQSGRLLYTINDAHKNGTTAIAMGDDTSQLVSGGMEGDLRVWKISKQTQLLDASLKEHRNRIWCLKLKNTLPHAVSASSDGSIIVWNLSNFTRLLCLFESTLFKSIVLHADESQLLSVGSNRKISFWDMFDGSQIRILESMDENGIEGELNAIEITKSGSHFITGGETKEIQIWNYNEGVKQYSGIGHSGVVTNISISPDQSFIVSSDEHGSVFIWKTPEDIRQHALNDVI